MNDRHFNSGIEPVGSEEDARRLVLDAETERMLEADVPDGRQSVVEPPVGTIGGPMPPPGHDVTTTQARTIPAGGGPGDTLRTSEDGDEPAGNLQPTQDTGAGASSDPA